ncbi:RING finger protein 214 [Antennarius striatus]|uniref:RING finger protein 214 n=1 Tax=Antennarius striatus TaxID=241820 RepID=UPI0035B011F8
MDASWETISMASEGEDKIQHLTQDDDLELQLAAMTVEDLLQKVQAVQTDSMTNTLGVNTDPNWESQVAAMCEYTSNLTERYNGLMKKHDEDEVAHEKLKKQLEKKKEDAFCKHQALLDKVESVRVKLQLNNSKGTKKNFLAKKQEMTSEKNKAEEERNRLTKELEENERKLMALTVEQNEEQRAWQEELDELRQQMERVRKEAKDAELQALQDEIAAVEKQRDVAMDRIETWLKEVGQYLNALRTEFPQHYLQERQKWEKKEGLVRRNQADLLSRFQEVLQQLQLGRELESLPRINVPSLPQVSMADLIFNRVIQSLPPPSFMSPPHPNPMNRNLPPQRHPNFYQNQQQPPHHPQLYQCYHHAPPNLHFQPPFQTQHQVQLRLPPQHPPQHQPQPHMRASLTVTPLASLSPSPPFQPIHPVAPSTPPPATAPTTTNPTAATGKLDKFLDKLGTRFPQCSRAQLTMLLQQVKSSRGMLAGMLMEEVIEQVGLKLAENQASALRPISRPTPAPTDLIHRLTPPLQKAAAGGGGQAVGPRKLCLMCQNHVDPESHHPLSCSHIIHKDCIKMWLQSSKNNSCPFCMSRNDSVQN